MKGANKSLAVLVVVLALLLAIGAASAERPRSIPKRNSNSPNSIDYYDFHNAVAEGMQRALDECRERFKYDRWNCPKRAFVDILHKAPKPTREDAYLRALIASSVSLSIIRTCSFEKNRGCACPQMIRTGGGSSSGKLDEPFYLASDMYCQADLDTALRVLEDYMDVSNNGTYNSAHQLSITHNIMVGWLAVKKKIKDECKCHGASGNCQMTTECQTRIPSLSEVADHLREQYRTAAKVGAASTHDTDPNTLDTELRTLNDRKLVFIEASPDYCYEQKDLGIFGTLGRPCSKTKTHEDGSEVSKSERYSCDKLCTQCGYKVEKYQVHYLKQCDCRFEYCCKIECKRCPAIKEQYRCAKHT